MKLRGFIVFITGVFSMCLSTMADYVNSFEYSNIKWSLSANMFSGTKYCVASERPKTTSICVHVDSFSGCTGYYDVTLTKFTHMVNNASNDIKIPVYVEWDTHGSLGVLRGTLQYIASDAFYNKPITSVDIPSSILGVKLPCFRNCSELKCIKINGSVNLSEGNYTVQDGVLYNKEMTKLLKYPEGKEGRIFVVPETVTEIAEYALANTKLTAVQFLGNCPKIADTAFSGSNFIIYRYAEKDGWPDDDAGWGVYIQDARVYDFPKNGVAGNDCWTISDAILYRYTVDENGKATITDAPDEIAGEVSIPQYIGSAKVVRIGKGAFEDCSLITSVIIPDGVTHIGNDAFYWCKSLESIKIPSSVIYIGDGAFAYCDNIGGVYISDLKAWCEITFDNSICERANPLFYGADLYLNDLLVQDLKIPNGVTRIRSRTFEGCGSITNVDVSEGVEYIDSFAFGNCTAIENVVFSKTVINVDAGAFDGCDSLTSFIVDEENLFYKSVNGLLLSKDGSILYRCPPAIPTVTVTIPSSVKCIAEGAFYGNELLEVVNLPEELCEIEAGAFMGCYSLKGIVIPNSVTNIGEAAFMDCDSLKEITLPSKITTIEYSLFDGCKSLEKVDIPYGVTEINAYAFYGCESLVDVTIPDSVCSISASAFEYCSDSLYDVSAISGVKLVDGWVVDYDYDNQPVGELVLTGVRGVGNWALSELENVTSIVFPDSVKYIGVGAVADCCNLKEVSISSNVTDIAVRAFSACPTLKTINIDESNNNYKALNGIIYTKDGAELISFPSAEGFVVVPNGVIEIAEEAFYNCADITSVTFPASVKIINDYAFSECGSLTEVIFEGGMESIDMNVFCAFGGTPWLEYYEFEPPINDDFEDAITIVGTSGGVSGTNIGATFEEVEDGCDLGEGTVWWKWTALVDGDVTFDTFGSDFDTILCVIGTDEGELSEIVKDNDDYETRDDYYLQSLVTFSAEAGSTYYIVISGYDEEVGNIKLNWEMQEDALIPGLSSTATAADVAAALDGSADAELAANITDAVEYAAYREWALNLDGVTLKEVKASPNAWLSYALNTAALIAAAPKDGDVVIDTFESAANAGTFEFAVKLDGITVGENALEVNLKKVFDIEGAETLASGGAGFSSDNVEVNAAAPENGNVKFTVTPKMKNGEKPDSFFFRVKMK